MALSVNSYGASTCTTSNETYIKSLDKRYTSEGLRIFYTTNSKSPDAVADLTDRNRNEVPDYIENIAIQFNTSRKALNHLGFQDPLLSPRYKGVAKFIDIHVMKLAGNGLAYEVPYNHTQNVLKAKQCVLFIKLRNNLEAFPGNWSIVHHELFHLYQYGYTQFKASWHLESMSAWSERLIRTGAIKNYNAILANNFSDLEANIFNLPYNKMWDRLAQIADKAKPKLALPKYLLDKKYTNGEKVFKDDQLWGHAYIKTVLQRLSVHSMSVSKSKRWDPYAWSEVDQRDPKHNIYIIKSAKEAMDKFNKDNNKEVETFFNLIN